MIEQCMDKIHELTKPGEGKERKMELVALEYRARLLLERGRNGTRISLIRIPFNLSENSQ